MLDLSTSEKYLQVCNFQDLVSTHLSGDRNAICWTRKLEGDFAEIVEKVELKGNITIITPAELQSYNLSESGQLARKIILNDWKLLEDFGALPTLNLIKNYDRDDAFPIFPTDVYSFHVDRSPIPINTFLCTYHGESSDILPNEKAIQKVLIPEIRKELQQLNNESDDDFETFLKEHFFDLHYQPKLTDEQPISMSLGHLWRLAVDHPDSEVLPCIHRAPVENGVARLLMIC